jgi:hypothetical protein
VEAKPSSGKKTHRLNVIKKFGLEDKPHSIEELSKVSGIDIKTLKEVEKRGYGAYSTQPNSVRMKGSFKKGVNAPMSMKLSPQQWAMARVYSFIDGNPKHDNDLRAGGMTKKSLAEHTKEELVDIVHKAKCGKLKGLNIDPMTKDEIISHLVKSKCPEIAKLL